MTTAIPVIFIIFNRPDTTRQVLEAIRAVKPDKLLVIADGPRTDRPDEAEKCAATRAVIEEVDWDCNILKDYSATNMGCRLRVSSGITWAFEHVDKAIILEDDCVPSRSFFGYCAELLARYESDKRVMMISGDNHLFGRLATTDSYYFSKYPHVWGWATWRRAWAEYDLSMSSWPEIRDRRLFDQYLPTLSECAHWESVFQSVYDGHVDTWDYQWVYSIWANSGLSIAPARNLVHNIGFHADATHTKGDTIYSSLAAEELDLPLVHPATILANSDKDEHEAKFRSAHSNALPSFVHSSAAAARLLVGRAARRVRRV